MFVGVTLTPETDIDRLVEELREFFEHHRAVETARRRVCAECQFETSELAPRESHAPGCSRARP